MEPKNKIDYFSVEYLDSNKGKQKRTVEPAPKPRIKKHKGLKPINGTITL